MRAVVLVGGFGTRLRPLTTNTPKQMLPIVDRPMIEWVVGHLGAHGIDEAVLSLGFRPEPFLERYTDGRCAGVRLRYVVEDEPLDTAGAVRFAATEAGIDETFLVLNGDVMTDLDLGAMVRAHTSSGAEGTVHLHWVEDPSRYGVVPVDEDGRVTAFIEKPDAAGAPSHWINAGTYVLEPSVLVRIASQGRVSIERTTFPAMVEDGALFGFQADTYWIDAGTPETYVQSQLDLVAGRRGEPIEGIDPTAVVIGAHLDEAVVMADAVVDAGATVRRAVVLPGASVEPGAHVEEAIIGARAVVGAGARVDGWSIVGPDAHVAAGARLSGARVPDPEETT